MWASCQTSPRRSTRPCSRNLARGAKSTPEVRLELSNRRCRALHGIRVGPPAEKGRERIGPGAKTGEVRLGQTQHLLLHLPEGRRGTLRAVADIGLPVWMARDAPRKAFGRK